MSNVKFPKNGVLLFKTSQGEVIELTQVEDEHETYSSTYIQNIGLMRHGTGLYPVTIDILNIINQDGIAKVRIETTAQVIDREYKEKHINKYKKEFSGMLNLILNNISQKKDIYSDF